MNRDYMEKTSMACLFCRLYGFHTYGDGCAWADPVRERKGAGALEEVVRRVSRLVDAWKKEEKKNENK